MNLNTNQLLAYPIIDEIQYRQKIDPVQLNTYLRSLEESVLRSLLRGTEVEELISRLSLGSVASYKAMWGKNSNLNLHSNSDKVLATAYDNALNTSCRQDVLFGIQTLDWEKTRKYSKVPIVDGQITPNITIIVDGVVRDVNDPVYNILNTGDDSFWIEETTPGPHTLELQLPPAIDQRLNYLEIVPFPIFGMVVSDVYYTDKQGLDNIVFTSSQNYYEGSGPLAFHFAPVIYNNTIKIAFNVLNGMNVMGFSNINVSFIDYNSTGTVYIPFNIPIDVNYKIQVNTVQLDYYVDGEGVTDDQFLNMSITNMSDGSGEIFSIPSITNGKQTLVGNNKIDVTNGGLYLKIIMTKNNLTTPIFRGCTITWGAV